MASSVHCGQAALLGLAKPATKAAKTGNNDSNSAKNDPNEKPKITKLKDYALPEVFRADRRTLKAQEDAGLPVYKVSKNGKLQARRVALSPDHRSLLVTTYKIKSFKGLFKSLAGNPEQNTSVQVIDLSRIDHILRGQMTKRFLLAQQQQQQSNQNQTQTHNETGEVQLLDEQYCLSIVYRECPKDQQLLSHYSSSSGSSSSSQKLLLLETLDLQIPHPQDYEALLKTLEDLVSLYQTQERLSCDQTVLLLQHHWVDMGKELTDGMSCPEWLELCDRINLPFLKNSNSNNNNNKKKKNLLQTLYKDLIKALRQEKRANQNNNKKNHNKNKNNTSDLNFENLPLWAVSELLNDVRFHCMDTAGLRFIHQDPMLKLWHAIMGTDPVPSMKQLQSEDKLENDSNNKNKNNDKNPASLSSTDVDDDEEEEENTISSVALLSYTRAQQKEFKTTLEDALALIRILNQQTSVKELERDFYNPNHHQEQAQELEQEQLSRPQKLASTSNNTMADRLTKSRFFNYLLSDANDLLDPARGKVGSDDMTHPLSHYWICSSHDTYWNDWTQQHDEQLYLAALYRGIRSLEMDVWDSHHPTVGGEVGGYPVIAKYKPKTAEDDKRALQIPLVLKAIRQFLLANPNSFPIILNIENHCSYKNQEILAEYLFQILGSIGLIVVPDDSDSVDELDLMPSPTSMKGKVLIMGKRPKVIQDGAKIINDDFDDENDQYDDDELPNARSREEEAEIDQGVVIGFDAAGPIKVGKKYEDNIVQHTPGELVYLAKQDLEKAKMDAAQSELDALSAAEDADRSDEQVNELIDEAGLTKEAVLELASQVKGVELDPVKHVSLLARVEEEGVEVQEFFAGAVEGARAHFSEADQVAIDAAGVATASLQRLNHLTLKLREAENSVEESYMKERKMVEGYQRAASDARTKREIADHAKRRVEKVSQLLEECETSASSAENVVVTAMTEAKISEKRASETEARAARAAAKAQDDRTRADSECRKEEDLERLAGLMHDQMTDASNKAKEARERMDKAASMLDRVNEQLKLIEQSSHYIREKQEQSDGFREEKKDSHPTTKTGKLLHKHASKLEERRIYTVAIKESSVNHAQAEQRRQKIQEAFEKKAHLWKNQTEVAGKVRKVADRSSHTAEELAEHAEEEREAANLRHVAREKAKSNVKNKGAYRQSLRAQLNEAHRAAKEAERDAQMARSAADSLSHVTHDLPSHDHVIHKLEQRKATRDQAVEDYEGKKKIFDAAEGRASEAKRVFDSSENVYSQAMRNAAKDAVKSDVQRQADSNAIVAFNQARLARKQAEHVLEKARYAQSIVTEKQVIVKRADEYKEKMERIVEIPPALAKMTFLHTTKHRYWDKSLDLPNTHVHSFAHGVLDEMKERDPENPNRLKEFSTEHICRTFPSWKDLKDKKGINSDPLLLWALGCQLVSLNYSTFDEHIIVADGRFRRNGSCGYVLKPENLTHYDVLKEPQETWTINILCGSCLPAPESGKSFINPFVKLTVYGGGIEQKYAEHRTQVVENNGFCPVWDEKEGFKFTSRNPSMSMIVFTVWDKAENGDEAFIGASAMPVSCMREGNRSVALFDMYNSRAGPHAFASLLVRAQKLVT